MRHNPFMPGDAITPQPDTPPPNERGQTVDDLDPQAEPDPRSDDKTDDVDGPESGAVNTLINPENS